MINLTITLNENELRYEQHQNMTFAQKSAADWQGTLWAMGIIWRNWVATENGKYCNLYEGPNLVGEIRLEKVNVRADNK